MARTMAEQELDRRQGAARRAIGGELRRVREDLGLSIRRLGQASGVDPSHLARAERGTHALSQEALVAVADAMGCDVSTRLFQRTAPRVRDHLSVRMFDALFRDLHDRWGRLLEVTVYRPVRAVIDLVLVDSLSTDIVAGEGHSRLSSVEGQLRWAGAKADALPSAVGWPWSDRRDTPLPGRLLLLRSCSANHEIVRAAPALFRAAYPADPAAAMAALTGPRERWPGATILWVEIDGTSTRLLHGTPRAVRR